MLTHDQYICDTRITMCRDEIAGYIQLRIFKTQRCRTYVLLGFNYIYIYVERVKGKMKGEINYV